MYRIFRKYTSFSVLAVAAFVLSCTAGCHAPISDDTVHESRTLTAAELQRMSPQEIKEYYAVQEKRKKERDSRSLIQTFDKNSLHSMEKSSKMGNMDRQLNSSEIGGIFPWRSGPSTRSSTLKDRDSAIYTW